MQLPLSWRLHLRLLFRSRSTRGSWRGRVSLKRRKRTKKRALREEPWRIICFANIFAFALKWRPASQPASTHFGCQQIDFGRLAKLARQPPAPPAHLCVRSSTSTTVANKIEGIFVWHKTVEQNTSRGNFFGPSD